MINTVLNVDDICQDCPYFSTEMNNVTNYDCIHTIYISCEHSELCNHLRKHISKNANDNCKTCKFNNFNGE